MSDIKPRQRRVNKLNVAERNGSKRTANKRKKTTPTKSRFSFKGCVKYFKWLMIASSSIAFLGLVVYYGSLAAQNFMNRPIAEIIVQGDFEYVDRQEVAQYMESMMGRSFISESINAIRQDVKGMVWVDQVSLSRQWPEKLVVTITEQKPIARWGNEGFVNVRGELIATEDIIAIGHLPELSSESLSRQELDDNNAEVLAVMQQYYMLAQVFAKHEMSIKRLSKDKRDAWKVELINAWEIKLGRGDLLKKAERLTYLLENNMLNNIAVIDLRYSNGVSVKYKADDDIAKSNHENIKRDVAKTSIDKTVGKI